MQREPGVKRVSEFKDLIEWALAPIIGAVVLLGKFLRDHAKWLTTHESRIAVIETSHDAETEKRTEQRAEMIDTINATNTKIDDLGTRMTEVLVKLAELK